MFKNFVQSESKTLNHSGRSLVGETLQIEGDFRSSGSVDVAGLINGNVFVSDLCIKETGSVTGTIESASIEINGHMEGTIFADTVIVGKTAVIKGDINFKNTLPLVENEYQCTVDEHDFNFTNNVSTRCITNEEHEHLANFATGSNFKPYVTTVGLYSDHEELLVVGKLGQPVKMSDETDTTFILRWDT